jgi:ribose/xylose/arabinose/galactoside ABC-type transport system permease subunit
MPLKLAPSRIGIPTLIIAVFWAATLVAGHFVGISVQTLLSDTIKRAGMNGVLVLAMVPAIQSGVGPNFALPIGIVCGLFALVCAIELDLLRASWLFASILLSIPFAVIAGYIYGKLLNAVKGSEMTIATYAGFSIAALMCLVWLMIPFNSSKMGWFIGKGLRETIQLDSTGCAQIVNNFLAINIGGEVIIPIDYKNGEVVIPTVVEKVTTITAGKGNTTVIEKSNDITIMKNITIPTVMRGGVIPTFKIGDVTIPTIIGGGITIVNSGDLTIPTVIGQGITIVNREYTTETNIKEVTIPVAQGGVLIPTGLLLIFGFFSVLVWLFFKSKTGVAISAGGMNPKFAQASGLDIDRNRILANIFSTVLGAIGIIIYAQSFGYAQLYTAPLMMAFPAVAAILIGGATASRANVLNVIIGVILFQGLLTTALPVANEIFKGTDLSEIMRMIIQNGIILYALTQIKRGG